MGGYQVFFCLAEVGNIVEYRDMLQVISDICENPRAMF